MAPLVPSSPLGIVLDDLRRLRATHVLVDRDPPPAVLEAAQELGLPLLHLDPLAGSAEPAARLTAPAAADLALLLQTSGTTPGPRWCRLLAIHEVPSRIVLLTDLSRGAKVK